MGHGLQFVIVNWVAIFLRRDCQVGAKSSLAKGVTPLIKRFYKIYKYIRPYLLLAKQKQKQDNEIKKKQKKERSN